MTVDDVVVGQELPTRSHQATNVGLFLYNAAVWNPHRIHYDEPYATEVEGHDGVVVDGPLRGDWITQVALNWLGGRGDLVSFEFSNRQAAYVGDALTSGGRVLAVDAANRRVDLELFIRNDAGEIITPGAATVIFHNA